MKKNILVIGKIPPPIGGVTIHVKRLLLFLNKDNIPFKFVELKLINLPLILQNMFLYKNIFLHTSNSKLRLILVVISKITPGRIIFTLHSNFGRYGYFRNFLDFLAIKIADVPILINQNSFDKANQINTNAKLIPAFIPPLDNMPLPLELSNKIDVFLRNNKEDVFCTNAFNLSIDKNNEEVYCGTALIKVFQKLKNKKLIFSDPSGNYRKFFGENKIHIPSNVLMLTQPHDFINILHRSDSFIRATLTDGDSLSVKEALYFKKHVICSDCVDRPEGVILFKTKNQEDLSDKILNFNNYKISENHIANGYDSIKIILAN